MNPPSATVSLSQLEDHLWESANILRGPVDVTDFKTYIFPLLFLKRICDVWDGEYQGIVDETGDEQLAWFPESHRFQIPEDWYWNDMRAKVSNICAALHHAMRGIEQANPDSLYDVFGNRDIASDLLGSAYVYLIKKFADATNKKAGEFYTPRSVVRLMLDPGEAETIYDPTCGTGGMLISALDEVKRSDDEYRTLKLYRQECNLITFSIARMNLFLHGVLLCNEEQAMRAKMVEEDRVEAAIGLDANLFYNSPMESCIVVCNRGKAVERKGKLLFIDAVNEVTRERAQSFLKRGHQQRILGFFRAFADEPGFAAVVTLDEIAANAGNLSIPLYVKHQSTAVINAREPATLQASWAQWQSDGCTFWQQMDPVMQMLDDLLPQDPPHA